MHHPPSQLWLAELRMLRSASPRCTHKAQLSLVSLPNVSLPLNVVGCHPKIKNIKQKKQKTCFLRTQRPCTSGPSQRDYKVSPGHVFHTADLSKAGAEFPSSVLNPSSPPCRSKIPTLPCQQLQSLSLVAQGPASSSPSPPHTQSRCCLGLCNPLQENRGSL